jgi:hypothetical protein
MSGLQILTTRPFILTEVFVVSSDTPGELGHDRFLPHSLQFIIHVPPAHP